MSILLAFTEHAVDQRSAPIPAHILAPPKPQRKNGLFKKAYELGVLCSVDVAVIIFGHNKKLYEYSSGDINETIARFQYVSVAYSLARC